MWEGFEGGQLGGAGGRKGKKERNIILVQLKHLIKEKSHDISVYKSACMCTTQYKIMLNINFL